MRPIRIAAYTVTNALGRGVAASLADLRRGRTGLRPCDYRDAAGLQTYIGRVEALEDEPLTGELARFDCRNNRLARLGLEQDGFAAAVRCARERYGRRRVAVFMGTSTSGIEETERAYQARDPHTGALPPDYRYRYTQNIYSVADFLARYFDLHGPALCISTACSSSAKAFAAASRYLELGVCDAAVVGGVDSLCLTTLYGFNALGLVSAAPCRPTAVDRDGISIGEAAGFALLERDGAQGELSLLGCGESSDAHHMSSPHPDGAGAARAMQEALESSGLAPAQIDYINLHGTGTRSNDLAEARALGQVFRNAYTCSSTKGATGHALGAAGVVETVFCCLSVDHGFLPPTVNTAQSDPVFEGTVVLEPADRPVDVALSNSFGFGGSNCSVVVGRRA